ncbi:hypothetical protein [Amycolatopsis sulphurea]|uniref:hypothetical protein n=1 Tax=Amycolatopsis sulphurea TaxID=76022 RepID=UPI00147575FB|nr:hypothetical protein [Amycolatopsis sulphurea]
MTAQLESRYERLADRHSGALWRMTGALTKAPATTMVPHLWRYTEAGQLVIPELCDRRVIAFDNPGTQPGRLTRTTDTL